MKWPIPNNKKIPYIYATSVCLFLENKGEEQILSFLRDFKELLEMLVYSDPGVNKKLCSPLISKENKVEIIKNIFGKRFKLELIVFINLLIQRNRFEFLEQIYEAIMGIRDKRKGISRGDIHLAGKVDRKRQDEIIASLSKITGKKVEGNFIEDTDLVAGFNTLIGNYYIDYSLKGQLEQLEIELKRS